MTMQLDPVSDFDSVLCPAIPDEFHRAQASRIPDRLRATFARHFQVVTYMRILEPHFGDNAFDCRRIVAIELGRVGVMRSRNCRIDANNNRNQACKQANVSHRDVSKIVSAGLTLMLESTARVNAS